MSFFVVTAEFSFVDFLEGFFPIVNVHAKSNIYHAKREWKNLQWKKKMREIRFFLPWLIAVSHRINVENENGSLFKLCRVRNDKEQCTSGIKKSVNKYLNGKSTALRKPFSWFRCKILTSYLYDNRTSRALHWHIRNTEKVVKG